MEWPPDLRRFASSANLLATMSKYDARDHSVSEMTSCHCKPKHSIYGDLCRRPKASECVPALEVTHDCILLFGGENHRFVSAGCLAADKAHGVRLLVFAEADRIFGHALYTKDMTRRVLSSVGLARCPLFSRPSATAHFQRLDDECDSVPPSWEQAVSENSLVAFYSCVRLGADFDSEASTTRVLRSAEPGLRRSIRVAYPPG